MSGDVVLIRPDIERALVGQYETAAASLVDSAKSHRITDDLTRSMAADIRSAIKTAQKKIEETRVSLVKPLNDHVGTINAKFKPMSEALAGAVAAIDAEIIRDRREREAAAERERRRLAAEAESKRLEAEEEQRRRAKEAAAKAEEEARAAGMKEAEARELGQLYSADEAAKPLPPVIQAAPPPMPAKSTVGTSGATSTVRMVWDFEVIDALALMVAMPMAVDWKRAPILAELRALEARGMPASIPGIRAFKKEQVAGS